MYRQAYLATPYSHPDRAVRVKRYDAVTRFAAMLIAHTGIPVFSPITHSHPIAEAGNLPLAYSCWQRQTEIILPTCDIVIVYTQPGWNDSVGVRAEVDLAYELEKLVAYIDADNPAIDEALRCAH